MSRFRKVDLEKYQTPSRFLKFFEGENRIRVLTEPYLYEVVGKQTANGYSQHIIGDGQDIPEFLRDVRPKTTWGFVVYSHDTGHFHIVATGPRLGDPLTKLLQKKAPEEYKAHDIIIHKTGERLKSKYKVEYASKSQAMPKDATRDNPEYMVMLSYFF